ncbi:hypothetical protein ASG01_07145 [Chryseobacterium sp. Leaf180]|uniref:GNAT family N-acetyltransferase n=1 Tax=Chryseobacterium sp. Leaf180 TaxID=1736289 RepID=UPI0006F8D3BF|nr:GNAT family N-acetyltransferase [Chryseobacterium sp. Leaf180]KQR95610.1 hypothetical protein ASG01_07145 [Chryseobacterium sp. Leaf180]
MEWIQITSPDDFRVKKIYDSYSTSFPEDERRDWYQFVALFCHPKVKIFSVIEEANDVGYLILWELKNHVFVEHFEVFTDFRNRNLGSQIVSHLLASHPRIILEIEPSDLNENSKRRFSFYQKNNFHLIDEMYVQPSYGKMKNPVSLWLLSNYHPENLNDVKDEIHDVVYH